MDLSEPSALLGLTARFAAVGVLLQTTELLVNGRELRDGRLLGWTPPAGGRAARASAWLEAVDRWPGNLGVLAMRGLAALAGLLLPYGSNLSFVALGVLVAGQLYYNRRFLMLASAADTLFLVAQFAAWVGAWPGATRRLQGVALVFLAAQVALAYAAAGWDKLLSPGWRRGARLRQLVRQSSYAMPAPLARIMDHPALARGLTWAVIGGEIAFPLVVFLPAPGFWIYLSAGLLFHAVVAIVMGLHGFWWAFLAAYPSLLFVRTLLER